jgi:hypothetical protein
MQPRDISRQEYRGQDLLGDVLGLDESDKAELRVALRAEKLKPVRPTEKLVPRNVV